MSDKEIISAVVKGIVGGVWFDENDDVPVYLVDQKDIKYLAGLIEQERKSRTFSSAYFIVLNFIKDNVDTFKLFGISNQGNSWISYNNIRVLGDSD